MTYEKMAREHVCPRATFSATDTGNGIGIPAQVGSRWRSRSCVKAATCRASRNLGASLRRRWCTYFRVKAKITHQITDDLYVLKLVTPQKLNHRRFDGEIAHHFKALNDTLEAILQTLPQPAYRLAETFDMGLRVVVVMVVNTCGLLVWTQLGKDFDWITPLQQNYRIISRGYTNPKMRGRPRHGRCITAALHKKFDEQAESGRVMSITMRRSGSF